MWEYELGIELVWIVLFEVGWDSGGGARPSVFRRQESRDAQLSLHCSLPFSQPTSFLF